MTQIDAKRPIAATELSPSKRLSKSNRVALKTLSPAAIAISI